jgi:aminopeptidase N
MEWWTHLWLNEGFATWMENFATDFVHPEFGIWQTFVSEDFNSALKLDALESSHPIEVDIHHPDEVDEIFDDISYAKGSVVVRMCQKYLGDETFRKGLAGYMKKHAWKNTLTADLWAALEEASNQPIKDMMEGWTRRQGFPYVTVEEKGEGKYQLSQARFFATGPKAGDDSLWYVPISFLVPGCTEPVSKSILKTRTDTVQLQLPAGLSVNASSWVKLNAHSTGFYRTLYPRSMLDRLAAAIKAQDPALTSSDRMSLQGDAFAFALAGMMPLDRVLDLVESYRGESDYSVCLDLLTNLARIYSLILTDEALEAKFSRWMREFLKPIYQRFGFDKRDSDSHTDGQFRALLVGTLIKHEDEELTQLAATRFAAFIANTGAESPFPADLRRTVFSVAAREGGLIGFEALMGLYKSAKLQEEKVALLSALSSSRNPKLMNRILEFSFSPEVRNQDSLYIYGELSGRASGQRLLWSFLTQNWQEIIKRHGGAFSMNRLISYLGSISDEKLGAEIEAFFADPAHPAPGGDRAVKQAIESIKSSIALKQRELENVRNWFNAKYAN